MDTIQQRGNANNQAGYIVQLTAVTNYGQVWFEASMVVPLGTQDAAAARFPKSLRVRPVTLTRGGKRLGYVGFRVDFTGSATQRARNESGVKRLNSFLRRVSELGYSPVWLHQTTPCGMTYDQFIAFADTQH